MIRDYDDWDEDTGALPDLDDEYEIDDRAESIRQDHEAEMAFDEANRRGLIAPGETLEDWYE